MLIVTMQAVKEVNDYVNNNIMTIIQQMNIEEYTEMELKEFLPVGFQNISGINVFQELIELVKDPKRKVRVNQLDFYIAFMLHSIIDTYSHIRGDEKFVYPYEDELKEIFGPEANIVKENILNKWGSVNRMNVELFRETDYCFD